MYPFSIYGDIKQINTSSTINKINMIYVNYLFEDLNAILNIIQNNKIIVYNKVSKFQIK